MIMPPKNFTVDIFLHYISGRVYISLYLHKIYHENHDYTQLSYYMGNAFFLPVYRTSAHTHDADPQQDYLFLTQLRTWFLLDLTLAFAFYT